MASKLWANLLKLLNTMRDYETTRFFGLKICILKIFSKKNLKKNCWIPKKIEILKVHVIHVFSRFPIRNHSRVLSICWRESWTRVWSDFLERSILRYLPFSRSLLFVSKNIRFLTAFAWFNSAFLFRKKEEKTGLF